MTNFAAFIFGFAVLMGIGVGLMYIPALVASWSYFPNRKGLITGVILAFYAWSSAIFDPISTAIINPDNKSPDVKHKNGSVTDHYYSYDIASGTPAMLRFLALIWLILAIVGLVLVLCLIKKADPE